MFLALGSLAKGFELKNFKKPSREELRKQLTAEQFHVTQEKGTEAPFKNAYVKNSEEGLYVDLVSGEPLFSTRDQFDSGTGWPSFTRPVSEANISLVDDVSMFFFKRTEVRSKLGDSHLGHVFDDGPKPTGKRFCMNSAALKFIPSKDLKSAGYEEFLDASGKLINSQGVKTETAILAGGCFWGVEEIFSKTPGIVNTTVGYTGGTTALPTYEDVVSGKTGHAEAIEIKFDPTVITYTDLLKLFFRLHDPTTLNKQHNDIGTQYRSSIFYLNPEQLTTAKRVLSETEVTSRWKKPIVTQLVAATTFFAAEEFHQNYLQKNPGGYTCHYLRD